MHWSFSIGRFLGSDLRVHVTFFLLLVWIGAQGFMTGGVMAALESVLFILVLFSCVIAHEYGHALRARTYGINTPDITLLPIGGMARMEKMPQKPQREIAVALAGPAVNIVIFAVLYLLLGGRIDPNALAEIDGSFSAFWSRVAILNLYLALFNLIPAFPMDGGRVLRAVLAFWHDRPRATHMAAVVGQILAFGFGLLGLSAGNPFMVLIAFFIFFAANAEDSDIAIRALARRLRARDALITNFESLYQTDTIEDAGAALIRSTQHEFPVFDPDFNLMGFLTRKALYSAVQQNKQAHPVSEFMDPSFPSVRLDTRLDRVLDAMANTTSPVQVTNEGGQFIGYINRENIGELMMLQSHRSDR